MRHRSRSGARATGDRLRVERLEDRRLLAVGPLVLEPFGSGFTIPVVATHAGDGSGRLFIAEQGGVIHVVKDGERSDQPFLDISDQLVGGGATGERGLLGLAFHPDYGTVGSAGEGLFYVYYSAPRLSDVGDHDSVVAEFRVSSDNADVANAQSQRNILRFNQPFSNHNAGDLKFGPDDGLLYIASGDGGRGGDPLGNGQDGSTLLGAILRIDVSGDDFPSDDLRNYAIPGSNPFRMNSSVADEVYALGLRNPFRMSFDDGPDGSISPDRLFVGDVGQDTFEEVNTVTSGGNYGWNTCEGDHLFRRPVIDCPVQFDAPIAEYGRNEGVSVIGGFVYRGSRSPSLQGTYLFGDLNGTIMALEEQSDGSFARSIPEIAGSGVSSIVSFGEDDSGELYALTFDGVLAIRAANETGGAVNAAGDVRIELQGSDLVVGDSSGVVFRGPSEGLTELNLVLSATDDVVTISNLSDILDLPIRIDGLFGNDTIMIEGAGHSLDLTADRGWLNFETIDVVGSGSNQLTLNPAGVAAFSSSNGLRVAHDEDDVISYVGGWTTQQPELDAGQLIHRLAEDESRIEIANTRPFQNPLVAQDANRDDNVTALDAIQIINALAAQRGTLTVPIVLEDPFIYRDVSGDNMLSALDALRVINESARRAEAEGERAILTQANLRTEIDAVFSKDEESWLPSSLF